MWKRAICITGCFKRFHLFATAQYWFMFVSTAWKWKFDFRSVRVKKTYFFLFRIKKFIQSNDWHHFCDMMHRTISYSAFRRKQSKKRSGLNFLFAFQNITLELNFFIFLLATLKINKCICWNHKRTVFRYFHRSRSSIVFGLQSHASVHIDIIPKNITKFTYKLKRIFPITWFEQLQQINYGKK